MLLSRFGLSVSGLPLTLTERVHGKDTRLLGTDWMCDDESPDMFRYEITALHSNITEYYEFSDEKSCAEVEEIWLSDVEQKWGTVMRDRVSGDVEARPLWDKTTKDSSEAIALPPPKESSEE